MAFHINAKKAAGVGRLKASKAPLFASTALASAMLVAAPAMAQDAAFAPASMVEQAQTGEPQDFSIAPQPRVSALDQFSEQTGVAFAYTASQLEGLQAQGGEGVAGAALRPGQEHQGERFQGPFPRPCGLPIELMPNMLYRGIS